MIPLQQRGRSGDLTLCRLRSQNSREAAAGADSAYLRSTLPVPSRAREIQRLAKTTCHGIDDDSERIRALVDWIQANVEQAPVTCFPTSTCSRSGRPSASQGNTYLYTALARASGIPTRVVNGIVNSESGDGFLYHTWAESMVAGRWIAVDPTFGQPVADATHLKLVEGESLAALGPLTRIMGRVTARGHAVGY